MKNASDLMPLCLITNRRRSAGPFLEAIEAGLRGGVTAVEVREPDLVGRQIYDLCLRVREMTNQTGAALLVNDRLDVAEAVGADAVHLSWRSLPVDAAKRVAAGKLLVGASVHDAGEAEAAEEAGADYVIYGPIFPTSSKPNGPPSKGVESIAKVRNAIRIPFFVVGGISPANVSQLRGTGASGIAVVSAILGSTEPEAASEKLLAAFKGEETA